MPMTAMQTPDLVEAPSWSIRPELPVDIDQIHELHRAAFRGAAEAELVDAIRAGAGFIPELSLVAVAPDGSVLGHVLVSRVEFDPAGQEVTRRDVLALAPLAVLPAHCGRGIATALMRAALEVADLRDEPFVAVLGPQSFYARFGFGPASDVEITSPYDAAGSAYQVRSLGDTALEAGTVVYPPMFSEV
jgi:putative acetyltransferase